MAIYSFVFFLAALWLCLNPGKLVERIGYFLTPSLLIMLCLVFFVFLFKGNVQINMATSAYQEAPFLKGFIEEYQTLDAIAALNFGFVIATTLGSFGLKEKKDLMKHTVIAGIIAGSILALVYLMLSYM